VSALLRPAEVWPVFAPAGARIDALPFHEGDAVPLGASLLTLYVPDLAMRQAALQARLEQQRWQAATASLADESSKRLLVSQRSFSTVQAEMAGLQAEQHQYMPQAPFAGRLRDLDPDLQVGQWVAKNEQLAILVRDEGQWLVETWLDESAVQRLRVGDEGVFVTDAGMGTMLHLKVQAIDSDASRVLPRAELAVQSGGHVLTREKNKQLLPERAIYRVSLAPDHMPADLIGQSWRGQLTLHARWQALASRYLQQAATVLVRELGF